jgi:hypothetical protein
MGCDSAQRRRKTIFAFTLMFYSVSIKNGAHVVYFRGEYKQSLLNALNSADVQNKLENKDWWSKNNI